MKQLKEIIFEKLKEDEIIKKLSGAIGNENNVHFMFGKNKEHNLITFSRISEKTNKIGKRKSVFQISSWSNSAKTVEKMKNRIVFLFNRSHGECYYKCILTNVNEDTYDKETDLYGISCTFLFLSKDQNF